MESKLIAEEGSLKGLVFLLENENEWFLGRDPDLCTLLLEDPKVSRQHAFLTKTEDGILIENLSHTNPILINDEVVSNPTILHHGDRLKVGETTFLFSSDGTQEITESHEAPSLEALEIREEVPYATIFEEIPKDEAEFIAAPPLDLEVRERWLLKIISGPQTGAEFSMSLGKSYVIGSDPSTSDIIFYDLSVSRRHARISINDKEECFIEDLESRNGVIVNGKQIETQTKLASQEVVALGTTTFVVIDREGASETIVSTTPLPQWPSAEAPTSEQLQTQELASPVAEPEVKSVKPETVFSKIIASKGAVAILSALVLIFLVIVYSLSSLFSTTEEIIPQKDISKEIVAALKDFPEVTYTFNKSTGTLFLVGHVLSPVDKSQIEYNLKGMTFISHLDDTNVIVDQYIWQEMNNLLARNAAWQGVSIHATKPGVFTVTGYLNTRAEASALTDYLNLNFPYLDRLQNKVAVEEDLLAQFNSQLFGAGMNGVIAQMSNGELTLSGFIASTNENQLQDLIKSWRTIPGVRIIRNFVVPLSPKEAVINLSGKYQVTGFSTHDHTNINVVINGHILTRGDVLDGMMITSIQSNTVYLEKDGLKFKIEYNP